MLVIGLKSQLGLFGFFHGCIAGICHYCIKHFIRRILTTKKSV